MKKCKGCVRFEPRWQNDGTYHCCRQDYNIDKYPEDEACEQYWDRAEQEEEERKLAEETERKRKQMWAIYASKPPVKLPIVYDGYGDIPMCPTCRDMPYSTEQCHWCGQRFIQDEEVEEYNKPNEATMECPACGGTMEGVRSKYNGHFHGTCRDCGARIIE